MGHPIEIVKTSPNHSSIVLDEESLTRILTQDDMKDRHLIIVSMSGYFDRSKDLMLNFFLRYMNSQLIDLKYKEFKSNNDDKNLSDKQRLAWTLSIVRACRELMLHESSNRICHTGKQTQNSSRTLAADGSQSHASSRGQKLSAPEIFAGMAESTIYSSYVRLLTIIDEARKAETGPSENWRYGVSRRYIEELRFGLRNGVACACDNVIHDRRIAVDVEAASAPWGRQTCHKQSPRLRTQFYVCTSHVYNMERGRSPPSS
ncbi:unnamed protein product [Trichogramma brassicae]|uniref:Uncharacterized protein n=1 Tax=Trichogramma brassicae TaxID=86971 RepID=A0A6H5J3P8_9HYME|nr:unnamed protein product [Trichogramma brassicae]